MLWWAMGNKPVLGRLTANICIPSEKGLAPSEILRGFELDFVDLLRSESVEVTVIYKVLNWFVYSHFSYRRQNYYQIKKSQIKYSLWLIFFFYQHRHDTILTSHALKFNSFNVRMCIISKTQHQLKIFLFHISQNKTGSIQRFLNICNSLLNTRIPLF